MLTAGGEKRVAMCNKEQSFQLQMTDLHVDFSIRPSSRSVKESRVHL